MTVRRAFTDHRWQDPADAADLRLPPALAQRVAAHAAADGIAPSTWLLNVISRAVA